MEEPYFNALQQDVVLVLPDSLETFDAVRLSTTALVQLGEAIQSGAFARPEVLSFGMSEFDGNSMEAL